MINRTVLVGRLTRDPELKKTGTGKSVCSFTLAVNRTFGDKDEADFIQCVAWNHSADFLANYMEKGSLLGIEGRIQTRNFEDKSGNTVYVTEVVCDSVQGLESKKEVDNRQGGNQSSSYTKPKYQKPRETQQVPRQSYQAPKEEEPILDITSDDLPF